MKELPEINTLPVHELYLPVKKQKVNFSPYTVEQERNILTAYESDETDTVVINYQNLIKDCFAFDTPLDFDKLSAMEFVLMAVNLRCKSKGEMLEVTTECQKCKKPISLNVNIEENIIILNEDKVKDICKIDDNLSFEIVPIRMPFLLALKGVETEGELMILTAVHSISKVFWNEEIFTDFTPETLREKVKLTYPILTKIFESVRNLIKITLGVEIICPDEECGHKEDYFIRDFLKYLS